MENKDIFGKDESVLMYGVAVTLMVLLHVMKFPERIPTEYISNYTFFDGVSFEQGIGIFSSICVGIYAFISGYGLCVAFDNLREKTFKLVYKMQWHRLKNFYKIYWLVFILFIPYGLLSGVFKIDPNHFIQCFLGKASRMNHEWWYVWVYVKILVFFPLYYKLVEIFDSKIKISDRLKVCIWVIILLMSVYILRTDVCLSLCFMGLIFSRYKVYNMIFSIKEHNNILFKISPFVILWFCFLSFIYIYNHIDNRYLKYDIVVVPLFVLSILIILKEFKIGGVSKWFKELGKYSVFIWLTHSFFCYYYWQTWVIWPIYSIFIALWVLLLSTLLSVVLDKIYKFLFNKN